MLKKTTIKPQINIPFRNILYLQKKKSVVSSCNNVVRRHRPFSLFELLETNSCFTFDTLLNKVQPFIIVLLLFVSFVTFLLFTSNPFLKTPFLCVNSVTELNPVLQDPVLAIHPPCIYAGYVASAIAFSICFSCFVETSNHKKKYTDLSVFESAQLFFRKRSSSLLFLDLFGLNRLKDLSESHKKVSSFSKKRTQIMSFKKGVFLFRDLSSFLFKRVLVLSHRSSSLAVYTTPIVYQRIDLISQIRFWMLLCWCFLTIGILLGSWWAYHELGWGGWWFWDPVENASLMPWLLTTACIHSVLISKLQKWTFFFSLMTFLLSILGTFFVRSGLLASVHSFASDSTRGLFLLFFFLFLFLISTLYLYQYRLKPKKPKFENTLNQTQKALKNGLTLNKKSVFNNTSMFQKPVPTAAFAFSKRIEQVLLIQNTLFTIICLVVLCGTAAPVFWIWLFLRDVSTGVSFFNSTIIPVFTSILVLMLYVHYVQLKHTHGLGFFVFQKEVKNKFWYNKHEFIATNPQMVSIFMLLSHTYLFFSFTDLSYLESVYAATCLLMYCFILMLFRKDTLRFTSSERAILKNSNPYHKQHPRHNQHNGLSWYQQQKKKSLFMVSDKTLTRCSNSTAQLGYVFSASSFYFSYQQHQQQKSQNLFSNQIAQRLSHAGLIIWLIGVILSNRKKIQLTQIMHFDSLVKLGDQFCVLRSIDQNYGPTYQSICGNLVIYKSSLHNAQVVTKESATFEIDASDSTTPKLDIGKVLKPAFESHNALCSHNGPIVEQRLFHYLDLLCLFPEKKFYVSNPSLSTTKVAISTNLFTDFYALIGTGTLEAGWYTTIMQLPFIFCIWIGFFLAACGGLKSLLLLLKVKKLNWQ